MSDEQALSMPVRRFWAMARAINRISAEESLRAFSIARNSTNNDKDSVEQFVKSLQESMGDAYEIDHMKERLDRAGFNQLKKMG